MKMKRNLLLLAVMVVAVLFFTPHHAGAQCPEDPDDLGICDTLYVETFDCDHEYVAAPGSFDSVRVAIYVTHDSNTFWWEGPDIWVQDSIACFVIPLTFWHEPEGCADSVILPNWDYWNNIDINPYLPWMNRSMFRHIVDSHTGDTVYNRMLQMVEDGKDAWSVIIDIESHSSDGDSGHMFLSLLRNVNSQSWWEGERELLATLTFHVYISDTCDTTEIGLDSTLWPPVTRLGFTRYDAATYCPRHFLPVKDTIYTITGLGSVIWEGVGFQMFANLEMVSGDTLFGYPGDTLDPMVVSVLDNNGNVIVDSTGVPIPIPVTFTIIEFPEGATGQTLIPGDSVAVVYTDNLGMASVRLVLGDIIGVYRVSAESEFSHDFLVSSAYTPNIVANIEITATSPHMANGVDSSFVEITATDFLGSPVIGANIEVVMRMGLDIKHPYETMDHGDGSYSCFVTSITADSVGLVATDSLTGIEGVTWVVFEVGPTTAVILTATKPRDDEPKNSSALLAYAADTFGNIVSPPEADIVFETDLGSIDSVVVEDGIFTATATSNELGIATITATDPISGASCTTIVLYPAKYACLPELPVFLGSDFTVPINIFVPEPYPPLGYYDLEISFDPTKANFKEVSDGDTTDEFDTPEFEVISDSIIRIYQWTSSVPETLLTEGFEGEWPPPGWSDIGEWDQDTSGDYTHTGYCGALCPWGESLDEWLITPTLTLGASSRLKFWWKSSWYWHVDPYDNGDLFVKISTNGGASWDTLWTFGDSAMVVNSGGPWPWTSWEWYEATLTLSAYTGDVLIAFNVVADSNANIAIDDVEVSSAPKSPTGSVDIAEVTFECIDLGSTPIGLDLWQGSPYSLVDIWGLPLPHWPNEGILDGVLIQKKVCEVCIKVFAEINSGTTLDEVKKDIEDAQKIFDQCCNFPALCGIKFTWVGKSINGFETGDYDKNGDGELDDYTKMGKPTDEEKELFKNTKRDEKCINAYYFKKDLKRALGQSMSPGPKATHFDKKNSGAMLGPGGRNYAQNKGLAHEMAHFLGECKVPDLPDENSQNLMESGDRSGTQLTQEQCQNILKSGYLKLKDP